MASRSERAQSVMLPVRFIGPPPVAVLVKPETSAGREGEGCGHLEDIKLTTGWVQEGRMTAGFTEHAATKKTRECAAGK